MQVQNSSFIQNWRRRGAEYPRFGEVRDRLWANFSAFREFLASSGFERPDLLQVEVSYINWIPDLSVDQFLNLGKSTNLAIPGLTAVAEDQFWEARYRLPSPSGVVRRLHAQTAPAVKAGDLKKRGMQFSLIVRAAAGSGGMKDDEAVSLIEDARAVIVQSFASLTTSNAQEHWERLR
jgi:uncharacterized protein (TIGR04255 family)